MSDQRTPLQKIDDAVNEYLAETSDHSPIVTGWTLGIATARIQPDNDDMLPMVTGMTYTLGPQTSIIQMAGLGRYLSIVAENEMLSNTHENDDED